MEGLFKGVDHMLASHESNFNTVHTKNGVMSVLLSVTSISSHSFEARGLKFGTLKSSCVWLKIFFHLLKCALQNQSLKAHYKAGNIFVGFFMAT